MNASTSAARRTQIVAHRGGAALWPENTMRAFKGALSLGVDAIELDVHPSADGVPMVIHDPTLERVCAREGAVHELDSEELQRVPASEPDRFGERFAAEKIVTLARIVEFIAAHSHVRLFVEVKPIAVEAHGAA